MELEEKFDYFSEIPQDTCAATKFVVGLLLNKVHPVIIRTRNELRLREENESLGNIRDVFTLCCNQIKKCILSILDVFKLEHNQRMYLQESRQCNIERLQWCLNRLMTIHNHLEKADDSLSDTDDSINVNIMYFVNWIDNTFEILNKLASIIYKTDYKESDQLNDVWKHDIVEHVTELHLSIDELLLSAMTLCRYCLQSDQHIVKARCQVVLRETKALLSELIDGDLSSSVKATPETLKLPIMPSNVNVLIDVLKDVLYVLETNTNTALLALLIHCFSNNKSPIDVLKEHFNMSTNGMCACLVNSKSDITEDCSFVKAFDLYNERLLQIGSFAMSCSSDQNRVLPLRSGLASLEALDPHLVPALMMSTDSHHTTLLIASWTQEIQEIRNNVFLIVDPAAFAEKAKQMMHLKLLEVLKESEYNNSLVCSVINIGSVVSDFFDVYNKYEPDALTQHETLSTLLSDLNKVQNECKIVSNLLSSDSDFMYDIKMINKKDISLEQLLKRLKLLYTLVNRINSLLHPKENEEFFASEAYEEECKVDNRNETHTVYKNTDTYEISATRPNISRSIFARTSNGRFSTRNFPLLKLTKHLRKKRCDELSFSVQLDQLCNGSENDGNINETIFVNKYLDNARDPSVLYNFSPIKNRSSLRKAILNRNCKSHEKMFETRCLEGSMVSETGSLMDETMSLQITDVLNQINEMTCTLSGTKSSRFFKRSALPLNKIQENEEKETNSKNVLTLNINHNNTFSKHIWNIPVNTTVDVPLDDSVLTSVSNLSQPSNVGTLERMNDLEYVESKLNSLKSQLETSL
ncbi:serendipity locus protein alpha isoform X1 [Manduca sexta]|uniref:serendipity locus protein alpha isoform X1 n=1 Tax=Manduca sexta TaxID=7130 RepID=UPI0018904431|nr:serendipity locus protein alpha isoform X1 [Manduca sexta]